MRVLSAASPIYNTKLYPTESLLKLIPQGVFQSGLSSAALTK